MKHKSISLGWIWGLILMITSYSGFGREVGHPSFVFSEITPKDGLPNAEISVLYQDKQGYMWIGTYEGLVRYDRHNFKRFLHQSDDSCSLSNNNVHDIIEDQEGYIWISTRGGGLNRFDPVSETFMRFQHDPLDPNSLSGNECNKLFIDGDQNLWITTFKAGFNRFDKKKQRFDRYVIDGSFQNNREAESKNTAYQIVEDPDDGDLLWIGGNRSLLEFHKASKQLIHHPFKNPGRVTFAPTIMKDRPDEIWVGTWGYGLFRFDKKEKIWKQFPIPNAEGKFSGIIRQIEKKGSDELWIGDGDVGLGIFNTRTGTYHVLPEFWDKKKPYWTRMAYDHSGRLWLGTFSKIRILDPANQHLSFLPLKRKDLFTRDAIVDERGNMYVASGNSLSNGLTIFDAGSQIPRPIAIQANPLIQSYSISDLLLDSQGKLWAVTSHLGRLLSFNPQTDRLEIFKEEQIQNILSRSSYSSFPTEVKEDCAGNLWMATARAGLIKIDRQQDTILQFVHPLNDSIFLDERSTTTGMVLDSSCTQLWLSTSTYGVYLFDLNTETFVRRFRPNTDPAKGIISGGDIVDIEMDATGKLWLANKPFGIQIIDPQKADSQALVHYHVENGLPSNRTFFLTMDDNQDMWIFSSGGLTKFNHDLKTFQTFGESNGLAFFPTSGELGMAPLVNGEIFVGQNQGLLTFHPDSFTLQPDTHPIVFSWLKVFDQEITLGKSLNHTERITLDYKDRFFTIGFASLDFAFSKDLRYAYQLEGLDESWFFAGNQPFASYTNIPVGQYILRVRTYNDDQSLNGAEARIRITIRPPWYRSWSAYLIWALITFGLTCTIYHYLSRRRKLKNQLFQEQQEAARLKELDESKSRLFTNITHELRTPLTIIKGLNEESNSAHEIKEMIHRNANNLLTLINQILDLSKIESGMMDLQFAQADIQILLRYLTYSFQSLASAKFLNISFHSSDQHIVMDYDEDKIVLILSNLLSNAIKFTPEYGSIFVESHRFDDHLLIKVRDTGIGISQEEIPFVFDRFQQVDASSTRKVEGSGIGLALVKEMVRLMKGQIELSSKLGAGSTFTLTLPIQNQAPYVEPQSEYQNSETSPIEESKNNVVGLHNDDLPRLLLVEDNLDMIAYLRQILHQHYQLSISRNGAKGIEEAKEEIPDIILSDVMMPEKDGFELCKVLKSDQRTSHIPIILLTAKADQYSKETGLMTGADAYLPKPFEKKELLIRLQKLIESRKILRVKYQQMELEFLSAGHQKDDLELQFLVKLEAIIRENLTTEGFKIEPDLCRAIGMSRPQLYRKTMALLNLSPVAYIRSYRMKRARRLIEESNWKIADIAQMVGMSDSSYFTKVYVSEFHETPKETRNRLS